VILVRERWEQKASLQACVEAGERKVQAQKAAACRRAWRLATAAVIIEQAWDKDRQQAAEKISGHLGREENMKTALGCGETFVFDPAAEASNFGAEVAGACAETMHRRMDLMPEPWVDPTQNYFLAACWAWGGLVWRWLNSVPCEVISCGSCGCNGGAVLLEAMQARVMGEGARFLILKSLTGGEDFWRRQGFEHFTWMKSVSWWPECSAEVRKAFVIRPVQEPVAPQNFREEIAMDGPPAIAWAGHGLKSEEMRSRVEMHMAGAGRWADLGAKCSQLQPGVAWKQPLKSVERHDATKT